MAQVEEIQFGEILDMFGTLIGQTDTGGQFEEGTILSATAYSLLNLGIKKTARLLERLDDNYFLEILQIDTVANQVTYDLPSNVDRVKQVWIDYSGTGGTGATWKRCVPINPNFVHDLDHLQGFTTEEPHYFLTGWRTLNLLPVPTVSTDNAYPLQVWGIVLPVKANARTSIIKLPSDYVDIPAYYAAMIYSLRNGDQQAGNIYRGIMEEFKQEMIDNIKGRTEDEDTMMEKADESWDDSFNNFEGDGEGYFL